MLNFKNVNVSYGEIKALYDVSMKVSEKSIVTLLGANGAGKSTVLKAISGIIPVETGDIFYNEVHLNKLSTEKRVRLGIAQAPEGRQVFSKLTVAENLKVGAFALKDKSHMKEDLERMFQYFPRLRERYNQVVATLSGGEQQMLAIARALMARPKLLLLDEPSLGIAPLVIKEIFQIIKDINRDGTSVLLVEQNAVAALKISDYAYVLANGKISAEGTPQELENGALANLYFGLSNKNS